MTIRLILLAVWTIGCGSKGGTPRVEEAPPDSPARPDAAVVAEAAPADAAPSPSPSPDAGVAAVLCKADAKHCCRPDGSLARPGGCSSLYPRGVMPATIRDKDGWCQDIQCNKKCLPAEARIRTPRGERAIATLRAGDFVWTADCGGHPQLALLRAVSATPATVDSATIELTLADGRIVRGSPGHPLVDGSRFESLVVSAELDGSRVTALRIVPLRGDFTHDILPSGPTGAYWADGVLIGSTLAPPACD